MKLIVALLIMILPSFSSGMNYSVGDSLNVVAIDGLIVRSIPSTNGKKITVLKTYERVCIKDLLKNKNQSDTIFGFKGNWVLIETKEKVKGYVFDAFLSTLPIARSMTERGKKLPIDTFQYSAGLPELLKSYAIENFSKTNCAFEYYNRINGESFHRMRIQRFQEGHVLIEHGYWESTSTEMSLKGVRISEIYYLIHQFLKDTNDGMVKINDQALRNPKSDYEWKTCVAIFIEVGCGIELYKDSENSYTIRFNFECC